MKRPGFTLLEVVIGGFLLLLAGTALVMLFRLGRSAQQSTIASYLVSGQADTAIKYLSRDLQESSLLTVRTYSDPPGCSFVSARNPSNEDSSDLNVSQYGAPLWTKTIFYTLESKGDLVRWERALATSEKDFVPRASSILPSAVPSGEATRRVVLHQVLGPNTKVEHLGGEPNYHTDAFGGFRVNFVRRLGGESGKEELSPVNPGDTTSKPDAADNTSLVDVTLQVLNGEGNMFCVEFQVHPRY